MKRPIWIALLGGVMAVGIVPTAYAVTRSAEPGSSQPVAEAGVVPGNYQKDLTNEWYATRGPSSRRAGALQTIALTAIDRAGNPSTDGESTYAVYDLDTGEQVATGEFYQKGTVKLPFGRFALSASVETPAIDDKPESSTLVVQPELDLRSAGVAKSVTFDARSGVPISVSLDQKAAVQFMAVVTVQQKAKNGAKIRYQFVRDSFAPGTVFAVPTTPRSDLNTYIHTVWIRPDASDIYNLVNETAGQIPARLDFRNRTDKLADVHTNYHAQAATACAAVEVRPVYQGEQANAVVGTIFALPTHRIEHFVPSADVAWQTLVAQGVSCPDGDGDGQTGPPVTFRKAGKQDVTWNSAPHAPGYTTDSGSSAITRNGDTLKFNLPMYVDSQPGHTDMGGPYAETVGNAVLRTGNKQICAAELGTATCALPGGSRDYQLTVSATRNVPWSTLSTRIESTWAFRSSTTRSEQGVPLLGVRYAIPLDDRSTAPSGKSFTVKLTTTTPATTATLSASFDEGASWRNVPVTRVGARWEATILNPASGGVSLRFAASDTAGNRIDQTLVDAYRVS